VDKDSDLEDRIRVQMNQFNFLMLEESAQKIASRKAKSTLEGGKHHDLIRIGCWDIFPSSMTPLEHGVIREKVVCN
jgi:hypothetical protein